MIRNISIAALLALTAATMPLPAVAQDALSGAIGGAIVGGVIGGAVTGRGEGAAVGAIIGGATGAAIGAEAERRRGYYWWHNGCYRRYHGGYVRVRRGYCY
jgi:uncharacterized protein YcfJ